MKKQNILTVDDDITILELLKSILSKHGYRTISALNGKDALTQLDKNNYIDAIILDICMPEMDGRKTLESIKSKEKIKNTPVLMLTGENAVSDVSECLTLGANDYMVKPFEPNVLISRLQKILPPRGNLADQS